MNTAIKNIRTLMYEEGKYLIKETDVYIKDDIIAGIDILPQNYKADRIIEGKNKLLMPGLINAHNHSYMTVFRNYADDLPFDDWLFGKILPLEEKLKSEECYWGSMLGIMEMIRTGTTTFADMYIFINETARAVEETGIRAVLSRGLVGCGCDDAGGLRRIKEAKNEIKNWSSCDRISFMLAPHAPYTCDDKYMKLVVQEAKDLGVGLNIHLSESRNEVCSINERYGCNPVEFLKKTGVFDIHTLAAHCVHLTDEDLYILAENNVHVVTNPVSNMKLGNGFAPVKKMLDKKINVALGTDGPSSNNTQNMFREMSFLSLIHKGKAENAVDISAQESLKIATVNGAEALGVENTGSIELGMKADLIIINLENPQFYPRNNLISALAYSSSGTEVETVIVNGKILMENNEFISIDKEKVYFEISKISDRLLK